MSFISQKGAGNSFSNDVRGRILIVDDDENVRRVLVHYLGAKGFDTVSAKCAEEALVILEADGIDLVVTDVNMPGMDGLELTRRIGQSFNTDVIVMTGCSAGCSLEDVKRAGSSEVFYKPINMKELVVSIDRLLG